MDNYLRPIIKLDNICSLDVGGGHYIIHILWYVKDGGGTIDVEEITEIVLGCFRMAGIEENLFWGALPRWKCQPTYSGWYQTALLQWF